jgi:hypothetical protein
MSLEQENAAVTTLPALITTEATSPFDYSTLDSAIAAEARTMADRIRARIESSHLDTGRDLLIIKDKLGHGRFGKWLKAEFNMSERTAQNLIGLAKYANDKPATVADLPTTAVYKLAAPSTPMAVQEEIERRVLKGERPSANEIARQIAKAKKEQDREASNAHKPDVESEEDIKAREKLEKDRADRERREREEAERLLAKRQRVAEEAIALLRERLGPDLVRFARMCRCAKEMLEPALASLIKNPEPIVGEAKIDSDPAPIEKVHAKLPVGEARDDPSKLTELDLSKAA